MPSEYSVNGGRDYIITRLARMEQMAQQAHHLRQVKGQIDAELRQLQSTANTMIGQIEEEGYDKDTDRKGLDFLRQIAGG